MLLMLFLAYVLYFIINFTHYIHERERIGALSIFALPYFTIPGFSILYILAILPIVEYMRECHMTPRSYMAWKKYQKLWNLDNKIHVTLYDRPSETVLDPNRLGFEKEQQVSIHFKFVDEELHTLAMKVNDPNRVMGRKVSMGGKSFEYTAKGVMAETLLALNRNYFTIGEDEMEIMALNSTLENLERLTHRTQPPKAE